VLLYALPSRVVERILKVSRNFMEAAAHVPALARFPQWKIGPLAGPRAFNYPCAREDMPAGRPSQAQRGAAIQLGRQIARTPTRPGLKESDLKPRSFRRQPEIRTQGSPPGGPEIPIPPVVVSPPPVVPPKPSSSVPAVAPPPPPIAAVPPIRVTV